MRNRSYAGLKAKNAGKTTETWFELSSRRYDDIAVRRNFLRTEIVPNCPSGFAKIVGKAYPDYEVVIGSLGGVSCLIDTKGRGGKDTRTLEFSASLANQYQAMQDNIRVGGLGFFLFEWRHDSFGQDFRLYSAADIKPNPLEFGKKPSITFIREEGLAVSLGLGLPDWLPVIIDYHEKLRKSSV